MLAKRIVSAIIGIILFVIFIFLGSIPFSILIMFITSLAIKEYDSMISNRHNNRFFLLIFSLFIIIYTYLTNMGVIDWPVSLVFFSSFFIFFIYHILFVNYPDLIYLLGVNLLGIIYIGGSMSFFLLLRDFKLDPFDQTKALWLVLLATWATDTGAYFVGRLIGRHKLAQRISPNKTIEGAFGGIIFCLLVVSLYTFILNTFSYYWLIYGLLVAVIAISGDLFESSLKRDLGVKDFGIIIPGHGGILDRFDSLFFAAPFTYIYLTLLFS